MSALPARRTEGAPTQQERLAQYYRARGAFVAAGSSLRAWCVANGVEYSAVRKAFDGRWNGPKGQAMVARVEKAAFGGQ